MNVKDSYVSIIIGNTPEISEYFKGDYMIETNERVVVHKEDYSFFLPEDVIPLPDTGTILNDSLFSSNGKIWKCVQTHERTIYPPVETPALFRQFRRQGEEWKQPLDAFDAYLLDDTVKHDNKDWISTFDGANVWQPGVVNETIWKELI